MHKKHSKTTSLTLSASRDYLPSQGSGLPIYLSLNIKAPEVEQNAYVNLVLLIDCSGSMVKKWVKQVINFAKNFINFLDLEDCCSIVAFAEKALILGQGKIENHKKEIVSCLDDIAQLNPTEIGGGSNLSVALKTGQLALEKLHCSQKIDRVVLLTDITTRKLSSSIFFSENHLFDNAISVIGLGDFFDENLLMAIAEKSGGNYYYCSNPNSIIEALTKELAWLRSITLKATILDYSFLAGDLIECFYIKPVSFPLMCHCNRLLKSSIKLGDLSGATLTQLLLELFVVPGNFSTNKLAVFKLLAKNENTLEPLAEAEFRITITSDPTLVGQVNTQIMLLVEKACLIKIKFELDKALAKGNVKKVFFLLKSLKATLTKLEQRALVNDLDFLLKNLSSEGQIEVARTKALTVGLRTISPTDTYFLTL
jgi:hypothetical protein